MGDVIHCLPALVALKRGFPDARIDWVVEEQHAGIIRGHPYIDRLIICPRKTWMNRPWDLKGLIDGIGIFIRELRQEDYDIVCDFQGLFKSGILVWLSRGKRKVGFDRVREFAHIFYTEKVHLSTLNQHAVTRYLEIPAYLGAPSERPEFFLPLGEEAEKEAHAILEEIGLKGNKNRAIIFINPNARWESKIWPWEHFRALIEGLNTEEREICLIGGPGDREKISDAFCGTNDKVHNIAGRTSLAGLAALFRKGKCLITNDSGPMHLAVAVGLPVVAMFGPTNPLRTGPFDPEGRNRVLCTQEKCSPCYRRECADMRCLKAITTDQVLDAVEEVLGAG